MHTSVKVVLFTSKTLSNGEHPVLLRLIKDRKPKYISVGFSCPKHLWDEKEELPKRKHPLYKDSVLLIQKKKLEASKLVLELEQDDKNLSAQEIKSRLQKSRKPSVTLFRFFDNVIQRLKATGQVKTASVYKDTKNNVERFTNGMDKHFSEVNTAFLIALEEYLKKAGKGANTTYIYLRTLRALINRAIKEEVCPAKYYGFKNFSLGKYSKIKTAKRAITKDDIEKIKVLDLTTHPELVDAKHIFLFSYYCRGMNFTDIAFLKWSDIQNGRLTYVRQKTKERFSLGLLEPAHDILAHYKEKNQVEKSAYIFPILRERHKTPTAIYNRKVKMLRKINQDLKAIALFCGIDAELTTYVARHSFATILKRQGVNTSLISEMLGHDSEKTTQVYLDSFESKILDEISKGLL
ncbi:site-specific integrase [Flavisolibacter nicotianae]|uniref:site-specific integrase n=1 Tax=Flavisolibacter nicotianae TaxID=2364882 RepID=UPI000EAED206|nr:site-specific integrase [Flavisolibacter nicotianae]